MLVVWLLYISEWNHKGQDLSNIRVTTKVAVNALLGDTAALRDYGSAIMHNLGTKEVKTMVCTPFNYTTTLFLLHILCKYVHTFTIMQCDFDRHAVYRISPCRCLMTSVPSLPWPSWSSSKASPTRTRCSGASKPSTSSVPSLIEKCPNW